MLTIEAVMKRNAEKLPVEANGHDSGMSNGEAPQQGNGANHIPSEGNTPQPRPEIAVLGWNIRSYRLSLRTNKA